MDGTIAWVHSVRRAPQEVLMEGNGGVLAKRFLPCCAPRVAAQLRHGCDALRMPRAFCLSPSPHFCQCLTELLNARTPINKEGKRHMISDICEGESSCVLLALALDRRPTTTVSRQVRSGPHSGR